MFKKFTLGAVAAVTALTALPTAAEAGHRRGYSDNGYYSQSYRDGSRYSRGDRYGRYDNRAYQGRYYGDRCRNEGTTGTIVGAIAGGLLGREIAGRGDRTVGTIIGGAAGALAGRAIDKDSSRNRC
ncbi:glycine zipper 2TM domain-containing protein [Allosphingosinicella flava]|uniref:17 kDa surface antigen n=1 Tax=Allosphingosinicella flava TaxID=2771430 RepID=A0A7T2LLW9_9SPHN|nr:glycine zipper 2TM domain-containing protein [Sphingosinicella flava]QPQ54457.1 glycine zipper 2TM domain-containing protein [Sphingosinicella flava]